MHVSVCRSSIILFVSLIPTSLSEIHLFVPLLPYGLCSFTQPILSTLHIPRLEISPKAFRLEMGSQGL